jgi:hypothetical protein
LLEWQEYTRFTRVVVQIIHSHCGIPGNETADALAQDGCRIPQTDISSTMKKPRFSSNFDTGTNGKLSIPIRKESIPTTSSAEKTK